jgi:guanine deaminase
MDEGYKILNLQGQRCHPFRSWWQATAGNGAALGMGGEIGTLAAGAQADFIVLDARATPAMALRMESAGTLSEELFCLQTMGDDRAIIETCIAGAPMKSGGGHTRGDAGPPA